MDLFSPDSSSSMDGVCCFTSPFLLRRSKYSDADDAGETKTEVCINPYVDHCCNSCARNRQKRYLPQALFFDILSHLPAQVLHDVMRHVCREWNHMIHSQDFIHRHLRNSTSGIVIQKPCSDRSGIYVEIRRGCLEICKFDSVLGYFVWSSCNGLVLAPDSRDLHILYVINPLTKQRAALPPYFHQVKYLKYFCLVFVEASMEYKVVHACGDEPLGPRTHIAVLTIGVDKVWRHIDIQHLPLTTRGAFMYTPLVTGGSVHWTDGTVVWTLNAETETFHRFHVPRLQERCRRFLPMGSNLSVVYSKFSREVWEMNPETGKWIKLLTFNLGPLSCKFKGHLPIYMGLVVPFGWLVVREVLLFSSSGAQTCFVAYNLRTREFQSFELDPTPQPYHFQAHLNSLVRLEGGF